MTKEAEQVQICIIMALAKALNPLCKKLVYGISFIEFKLKLPSMVLLRLRLITILSSLLVMGSVFVHAQTLTWKPLQPIPVSVALGVCFEAGGHIYLGGGLGGSQIYQYDTTGDSWSFKTSDPANLQSFREAPVLFTIGGEAYMGLGNDLDANALTEIYLDDLWKYSPAANTWTRKASIPGGGMNLSTSFAINGKAYIVGGKTDSGFLSSTWEYDPATDAWQRKSDFPFPIISASSFTLGGKGYVIFGYAQDTATLQSGAINRLFEYDPAADKWTEKKQYPGPGRFGALVFTSNGAAYAGTGSDEQLNFYEDMHSYDPATDSWRVEADFPAGKSFGTLSATVNGRVYAGNSAEARGGHTIPRMDWYRLGPDPTAVPAMPSTGAICYPNPAGETIHLKLDRVGGQAAVYRIYSALGGLVAEGETRDGNIDVRRLAAGTYFLIAGTGVEKGMKGAFVKQ